MPKARINLASADISQLNEICGAIVDIAAKTKVNILGNSMAITINKKIVDFLGLKKGEEVFVYPKNKHQIIIDL